MKRKKDWICIMPLMCMIIPIFLVIASANAPEGLLSKSRQANDRVSEIQEYINEKENLILNRDTISSEEGLGSAELDSKININGPIVTNCPYCLNDNFDQENSILWRKSDWRNNGDVFLNIWLSDPGHISCKDGNLWLTLDDQPCIIDSGQCQGRDYASGEYGTTCDQYRYGALSASIKAGKGNGTVTSMFLFGDRAGKQDEIDVEIFGKDASNGGWEMQTNYFRNGEMGGCWEPFGIPEPCHVAMIPLNFDPTESFHIYTISWIGNGETCEVIKWYVDDKIRRHVWLDEMGYIWSQVFDESGSVIEQSNGYKGSLPSKGSKIFLNLWAATNWAQAGQFNYTPGNPITAQFDWIKCYQPNCLPPGIPLLPSGPSSGVTGTSYSFSTSATDPGGDQVKYTFDWGDGTAQTETPLVNSGTAASATHCWSTEGSYPVKAMVADSYGATSGWSEELLVTISTGTNKPPETPSVPSGLGLGKHGISYSYSTSTIDPDGDKINYTFDWGDTKTSNAGPAESGTPVSSSHAWANRGIYTVKAMATDSNGASSGWSMRTVRIT